EREVRLEVQATAMEEAFEALIHDLLEKLVLYKDAEQLLLRPKSILLLQPERGIERRYGLHCVLAGEPIDPTRHELIVDVKAVTFHGYHVRHEARGWSAQVVLDV